MSTEEIDPIQNGPYRVASIYTMPWPATATVASATMESPPLRAYMRRFLLPSWFTAPYTPELGIRAHIRALEDTPKWDTAEGRYRDVLVESLRGGSNQFDGVADNDVAWYMPVPPQAILGPRYLALPTWIDTPEAHRCIPADLLDVLHQAITQVLDSPGLSDGGNHAMVDTWADSFKQAYEYRCATTLAEAVDGLIDICRDAVTTIQLAGHIGTPAGTLVASRLSTLCKLAMRVEYFVVGDRTGCRGLPRSFDQGSGIWEEDGDALVNMPLLSCLTLFHTINAAGYTSRRDMLAGQGHFPAMFSPSQTIASATALEAVSQLPAIPRTLAMQYYVPEWENPHPSDNYRRMTIASIVDCFFRWRGTQEETAWRVSAQVTQEARKSRVYAAYLSEDRDAVASGTSLENRLTADYTPAVLTGLPEYALLDILLPRTYMPISYWLQHVPIDQRPANYREWWGKALAVSHADAVARCHNPFQALAQGHMLWSSSAAREAARDMSRFVADTTVGMYDWELRSRDEQRRVLRNISVDNAAELLAAFLAQPSIDVEAQFRQQMAPTPTSQAELRQIQADVDELIADISRTSAWVIGVQANLRDIYPRVHNAFMTGSVKAWQVALGDSAHILKTLQQQRETVLR